MEAMNTQRIPIADLHCDTLLELRAGADIDRFPEGHIDIGRLKKGGVGLQLFAAFVSAGVPENRSFAEANELLDCLDAACAKYPESLAKARTARDVQTAMASGKTAAVPAIENGRAIECDLSKLEALASRGVRCMTLTHSRHLPWASSSGEEGEGPGGLTPFGKDVVRAMEDFRVIVDVSHVSEKTFWDVASVAKKPFIASHSCAAALCPVPRNLTDEQIRAIARSGGVIGVNFFPGFLDSRYLRKAGSSMETIFREMERIERDFDGDPARRSAEMRRLNAELRSKIGTPDATLDTVCDHVEHIARIGGEDVVAFGSDFDGVTDLPRGISGCESLPAILARLAERGWDESRLRKAASENFLRVFRATE